MFNRANRDVRIFIDRVDQGLKGVSPNTWIVIQGALLEAAYTIHGQNSHVKVYATIRKEAFSNYKSDLKANIEDSTLRISYDKEELKRILDKLANFYERESFEEFLHPNENVITTSGLDESSFDYLIRHTLYRPRDMVRISSDLSMRWRSKDSKDLINIVNSASFNGIIPHVFDESFVFLMSLRDVPSRLRFLSMLRFNILSLVDVRRIYAEFNNVNESTLGEIGLDDPGLFHPFTELYKIGLLGILVEDKNDILQTFRMPGDIQDFDSEKLPVSKYYIIHPGLRDSILQAGSYTDYRFIATGHELLWNPKFNEFVISIQNKLNALEHYELKIRTLNLIAKNVDFALENGLLPDNASVKELKEAFDKYANNSKDKVKANIAVDIYMELEGAGNSLY